jgi:DNA modification methylase
VADDMIEWLQGDCRERLRDIPPKWVHLVITSPPYFGLRSYGIEASVWGGRTEGESYCSGGCDHPIGNHGGHCEPDGHVHKWESLGNACRCGAWRGTLGNEPTVELYIEHMVGIFRQVRRILRDDGNLIVNMGDSWSGSGKGPTGHNGIGDQAERQGFSAAPRESKRNGKVDADGYKAKDLMLVPYLLADAMRRDGWYLRIDAPWFKGSAMPESVSDRLSNAKEVVFHFTKSARYYYDNTATRISNGNELDHETYAAWTASGETWPSGGKENYAGAHKEKTGTHPDGRARRNSDAGLESLDVMIDTVAAYLSHLRAIRREGGVLADAEGNPLGMFVNPQATNYEWCNGCNTLYAGDDRKKIEIKYRRVDGGKMKQIMVCPGCLSEEAWMGHYATFPRKLVEPWIKACTSEVGVCPTCRAPWTRVLAKKKYGSWHDHADDDGVGQRQTTGMSLKSAEFYEDYESPKTLGWRPSCLCKCWSCDGRGWVHETECRNQRCDECHPEFEGVAKPQPAEVLDIFGGSGTTGIVAESMGRRGVLIEMKPDYIRMSRALAAWHREQRMMADRLERESRLGQSLLPGIS